MAFGFQQTNKQQIDDAMLSFWGRFFRSLNRFEVKSTMINVFLICGK